MASERSAHETARDSALLRTLLSGVGLPLATALGALVTLPFVARSLSPAEFGVFVTLSGIFALISVADLGVGAALTLQVSSHLALGRQDAARVAVAAGILVACAIALLFGLLGSVSAFVLPWHVLLGATELGRGPVRLAIIAMSLSLSLFIVGSLGARILLGLQRGSVANVWMASATGAGAVSSAVVAVLDCPLYAYVLSALGVPAALGVIVTWRVARGGWGNAVRPRFREVRLSDVLAVAAGGGWYFVIAAANTVSYQIDVLIVAVVMGAPSAGVFAVVARLFGLVVQAVYPALLQLAPAFAEAKIRGETAWVRRRMLSSALIALALSGGACLVLVFAASPAIRVALTPDLVPTLALIVGAAVWTTYSVATAPAYFLLHGLGLVRAHAWMTLAVVMINLPVSWYFTGRWGLSGPFWGSLVATVLGAGIPALVMLRRRRLVGRLTSEGV